MKVRCDKCLSFVCDIKNKDKLEIHKKSNECIFTDIVLWNIIKNTNFESLINKLEYLLNEFGTKEPCNRFDVGNVIEFIVSDFITENGLKVEELPNAKRIDLCINDSYPLSIKYSSTGDITLHNSNSCINKDIKMTDLLLLTLDGLFLITNKQLLIHNIDINNYLKNHGDSLKLKRTLLSVLKKENYPYYIKININIDKKKCKNRLTSKVFYKQFNNEYLESIK
jgi:hypothetical protein